MTENLDSLRQKPDFEAKANQIVFYRWDTENDPDGTKANNFVEDYIEGCEHVWISHVEPLIAKLDGFDSLLDTLNDQAKKEYAALQSRIRELEEENKKLKWTA